MFSKKNNLMPGQIGGKVIAGFTILELIFVIFVTVIGILAIYGVYSKIVTDTNINISRLTAAYLAQEGVEIVRNIRDANWVNSLAWDAGLSAGNWEAEYSSTSLAAYNPSDFFRINGGGFYNYTSGLLTTFTRKITLEGAEPLKVKVYVYWRQGFKDYNVFVEEDLYNWYSF